MKKSVRRDKKVEEAAGKKHHYITTKKLTGKFQPTQIHIKNTQGRRVTTKEDQQKRWSEHFAGTTQQTAPPQLTVEIPAATNLLEINCSPPTKAGIKKVSKALRGGKTEGLDKKLAEALEEDVETSTCMLPHANHLGRSKCSIRLERLPPAFASKCI